MVHHWDEVDVLGPRYTFGSRNGVRLWELPHLLKYVLARRGITRDELTCPLSEGGLAAFVERALRT